MTWGAYFMFYDCPQCGRKFRCETADLSDPDFGFCPDCHAEGVFAGETKDIGQGEAKFVEYE